MNSITIEMPYIGSCITVNHYLGKRKSHYGFYVKGETQAWKDELGWKIKSAHIEDWRLPLKVRCSGQFRDKRSQPDLSNLSKVILDAIEETTGVNDSNFRWRDGDITIDKTADPILLITIEETTRTPPG